MRDIKDCYRFLKTGEIVEHGNFFIEGKWIFLEADNVSLLMDNIISKQESCVQEEINRRSMDCYKRVKP